MKYRDVKLIGIYTVVVSIILMIILIVTYEDVPMWRCAIGECLLIIQTSLLLIGVNERTKN